MTSLKDIQKAIEAEILQPSSSEDEINGAYCSDLLSDVMANAKEGNALITIQAHKNTIAVASLAAVPLVIICNSRPLADDMIEAAIEEEVAIYRTTLNQFETAGRIYRLIHDL